jgi:hypothetical protein
MDPITKVRIESSIAFILTAALFVLITTEWILYLGGGDPGAAQFGLASNH